MAAESTVLGSLAMEPHQDRIVLDVNVPVNMNVAPVPPPLRRTAPSSSPSSIRRSTDCSRLCTRPGPFDSQPCILMEIAVSVILFVASIMVLALSRNEKPHSLITLWIVGYASGCLATLPNLCLRYRRRLRLFVELFELASRCFFVCWVDFGFKLIRDHHSSSDAPNQYRLCIAIVATTFISYATLIIGFVCFLFCGACFPSLFGYQMETRGASFETLSALPMYKFKAIKPTEGNGGKYDCENPSKNSVEDGIIAVDTVQERSISVKDAMCCICLRKYEDDEHLRELPCTHYFHVKCVDRWLIIKASCPLCKHVFGQ